MESVKPEESCGVQKEERETIPVSDGGNNVRHPRSQTNPELATKNPGTQFVHETEGLCSYHSAKKSQEALKELRLKQTGKSTKLELPDHGGVKTSKEVGIEPPGSPVVEEDAVKQVSELPVQVEEDEMEGDNGVQDGEEGVNDNNLTELTPESDDKVEAGMESKPLQKRRGRPSRESKQDPVDPREIKTGYFECNMCRKVLTSKYSLLRHMQIHVGRQHLCDICNMRFQDAYALKRHKEVRHENYRFTCTICDKEFQTKRGYKLHVDEHNGVFKFKCDLCGKGFNFNTEYECHMNKHYNKRPYQCTNCKQSSFRTASGLARHAQRCKSEIGCCSICGKILKNKVTLLSHEKLHQKKDEKSYQCTKCMKTFEKKKLLKEHESDCVKNESNSGNSISSDMSSSVEPAIAKLTSGTNNVVQAQSPKKKSNTPAALHICQVCGKKFARKDSLQRHQQMHDGYRFKCEICGHKFVDNISLQQHIQTKHENFRYKCDECDKEFETRRGLKLHKDQHNGVFRFFCNICSQGFNYTCHYRSHMNKHNNHRAFACEKCKAGFFSNSELSKHRRACVRNEDYKCDQCDKRFRWRNSYVIHMKVHQGIVHQCSHCGKIFKFERSLVQHEKKCATGVQTKRGRRPRVKREEPVMSTGVPSVETVVHYNSALYESVVNAPHPEDAMQMRMTTLTDMPLGDGHGSYVETNPVSYTKEASRIMASLEANTVMSMSQGEAMPQTRLTHSEEPMQPNLAPQSSLATQTEGMQPSMSVQPEAMQSSMSVQPEAMQPNMSVQTEAMPSMSVQHEAMPPSLPPQPEAMQTSMANPESQLNLPNLPHPQGSNHPILNLPQSLLTSQHQQLLVAPLFNPAPLSNPQNTLPMSQTLPSISQTLSQVLPSSSIGQNYIPYDLGKPMTTAPTSQVMFSHFVPSKPMDSYEAHYQPDPNAMDERHRATVDSQRMAQQYPGMFDSGNHGNQEKADETPQRQQVLPGFEESLILHFANSSYEQANLTKQVPMWTRKKTLNSHFNTKTIFPSIGISIIKSDYENPYIRIRCLWGNK